MKWRNFLSGAAVGAFAGVVAGLLTAPRSGSATRADIAKQAKRLKNKTARKTRRK